MQLFLVILFMVSSLTASPVIFPLMPLVKKHLLYFSDTPTFVTSQTVSMKTCFKFGEKKIHCSGLKTRNTRKGDTEVPFILLCARKKNITDAVVNSTYSQQWSCQNWGTLEAHHCAFHTHQLHRKLLKIKIWFIGVIKLPANGKRGSLKPSVLFIFVTVIAVSFCYFWDWYIPYI